jgi:hypothetical protein
MKVKLRLILPLFGLFSVACSNFEDASLVKRNTFVRFFADNINFESPTIEVDPDGGYIMAYNIPKGDNVYDTRILKLDENGSKIWEQNLTNTFVRNIKPYTGGYLIAGIGIVVNTDASQASENFNTKAFLNYINNEGAIISSFDFNQSIMVDGVSLTIDFKGDAITLDNNGNILLLGSFKRPETASHETSFVIALSASNFQPLWSKSYGLLSRDYINCPSVYFTQSGKLIWASTSTLTIQNNNEAYVSIAYVQPNATFDNNSKLGENDSRNHIVNDIKPSTLGYGIIGTYQESNQQNANIYFARVNNGGDIIENSTLYFDGHSENIVLTNRDESTTEDEGNAIIGTSDGGYVLGCTVASTPTKGNGGTDIRLIKLDAFGNLVWTTLLGGPGDEQITALRETTDDHLIVCGTNTINSLSSVILMKLTNQGSLAE